MPLEPILSLEFSIVPLIRWQSVRTRLIRHAREESPQLGPVWTGKAASATQRRRQRPAKPQILPATPPCRNFPKSRLFPPIPPSQYGPNARFTTIFPKPRPCRGAAPLRPSLPGRQTLPRAVFSLSFFLSFFLSPRRRITSLALSSAPSPRIVMSTPPKCPLRRPIGSASP
jgi:hypothetical protein